MLKLACILISFICCPVLFAQQNKVASVERFDKAMQSSFKLKNYKKFLSYGDSILKIVPANKKVLIDCYQVAITNVKDTTLAMDYLAVAISTSPYDSRLLAQFGWIALLKKMPEVTLSACSDAYLLDRSSIAGVLNYAHALFISGDKANAAIAYDEVMHLISSVKEFEQYQLADFIILRKLYPKAGFDELIKEQKGQADTILTLYAAANRAGTQFTEFNRTTRTGIGFKEKIYAAMLEEKLFIPQRAKRMCRYYGILADYENQAGEVSKAISHYDTAAMYAAAIQDNESIARNFYNKAVLYHNLKLWDSANLAYNTAGAYYVDMNHQPQIAQCYLESAYLLYANGQKENAVILVKDSVLPKLIRNNENEKLVQAYSFIANDFRDRNMPDSQKLYLEKSLETVKLNLLPEENLHAVYTSLAAIELSSNNITKAKEYLFKVASFIPPQQQKTLQRINLNTNLGYCYFKMNKFDSAIYYLQSAVDILFSIRQTLSDKAKLSLISSTTDPFSFLAASYNRLKNYEGVFQTIERSKSLLLADKAGIGASPFPTIAGLQNAMNEDQVYFISSYTNQPGLSQRKILLAIDKHSVQSKIISDSLFLVNATKRSYGEYLDTILTRSKRDWQTNKASPLKTQELMIFSLFLPLQLEKARGQVRGATDDNAAEIKSSGNHAKELGKILYTELLTPFDNLLKQKKEIIILTDGFLSFVPFESLVDADGKYLVEKLQVTYLPSVRVGDLLSRRNKLYRDTNIALIGNPVFEKLSEGDLDVGVRSAYAKAGAINWQQLPGTEKEIEGLQNLYKENVTLSRENCTEEKVKKLFAVTGKTYKVVHFATHGYVMGGNADISAVILNQLPGSKEDGYLTAAEIEALKIPAQLVVLSACSTGKGMLVEGEGIQGLSSSFIIAGANSMIVSLWSVSDNSTQQFMQKIYELVKKENLSYKEAINNVKNRFIAGEFGEEYQKPYYWAPFIYIGN